MSLTLEQKKQLAREGTEAYRKRHKALVELRKQLDISAHKLSTVRAGSSADDVSGALDKLSEAAAVAVEVFESTKKHEPQPDAPKSEEDEGEAVEEKAEAPAQPRRRGRKA